MYYNYSYQYIYMQLRRLHLYVPTQLVIKFVDKTNP